MWLGVFLSKGQSDDLHVQQTLVCKGKENKCWERTGTEKRCLARQQGTVWKATYSAAEGHGQTIRPCMAARHTHSFAVSHNTRKRKWESLGPRPRGPRGSGRRAQHEKLKDSWKTTAHGTLPQKESQNNFVFKFLSKSARMIPSVVVCNTWCSGWTHEQRVRRQTHLCDRSVRLHLYWDHGQGAQGAKYKEAQRIRRRWWATKSRRRLSPDSDVISDLSCIYRGGLISTLFPCSHMSRCEVGPGGKIVALSRPGRWALESYASANPDEGPTSHDHWGEHKHHLFYIKSVRLNKEGNNLQLSRCHFSQIWPPGTVIALKLLWNGAEAEGRYTLQGNSWICTWPFDSQSH